MNGPRFGACTSQLEDFEAMGSSFDMSALTAMWGGVELVLGSYSFSLRLPSWGVAFESGNLYALTATLLSYFKCRGK